MKQGWSLFGLSLVAALVLFTVGVLATPVEAGGKGGGKCGDCSCVYLFPTPDGGVCVLSSCTLTNKKTCLWDCQYDCS